MLISSGWTCACSRPLWVSLMNSPVRLGVSPAAASTPIGVFNQRFGALFSPCWNSVLHSLSRSPIVLPVYLHANVGLPSLPAAALPWVLSAQLPISTPPPSLGECFFFNSLVVGLSYSLISVSSGCFLFLNLLFSFFWLYKEAQCVYLRFHLRQKSQNLYFK